MTGIEKISARMEADARAEADRLTAEAEAEAAEVIARYEKQAADISEGLRRKIDAEAEERVRRAVGVAELEARKRLLAAKQESIALAFDGAQKTLEELPEDDLVALLGRLASEASPDGEGQIVMNPADHTRIGKKVCEQANNLLKKAGKTANLTLSAAPRPIPGGGLILVDGKVEINCGFRALIDGLRGELVTEVAARLFG